MRIILKGCARCGGDLARDFSGVEETYACLQCGSEATYSDGFLRRRTRRLPGTESARQALAAALR